MCAHPPFDVASASRRYANLNDLARLPWFMVNDAGRLAVRPGLVGPIVDVHTHLALAYLRPLSIDLRRETTPTEYYLPASTPLDLDIYANSNFEPAHLRRMKLDLSLGAVTDRGMRRSHTLPNLHREMRDLGVTQSTILPIDWPVLSSNSEDQLRAVGTDRAFVGFAGIHPWDPRLERRLDALVALGARGCKVHPSVQMVRPDDRRAMRLYAMCGERGLPVIWHCGPVDIEPPIGRYLSQVRHYEKPIRENPNTTFILGHSGARQADQGIALQQRYPNVWLEIASQGLPWVQRIAREADPDRILFGSDWPFYPQAFPLAKVLIATEDNHAVRHKLLYSNAARLLRLPDIAPPGAPTTGAMS